MAKWQLTVEELFLIHLLFLASQEENHSELLIDYYSTPIEKTSIKDLLVSLQEKGVITKETKILAPGQPFDPETVVFNKNFLKGYLKYSGELGAQLLDEYPHFVHINGMAYDIANFAKKFNSEEDFYYAYGKAIGWKPDKHEEVLDLIKWAKENTNFLRFNICDFVIAKSWNRIQELKDGDFDNLSFDYTMEV